MGLGLNPGLSPTQPEPSCPVVGDMGSTACLGLNLVQERATLGLDFGPKPHSFRAQLGSSPHAFLRFPPFGALAAGDLSWSLAGQTGFSYNRDTLPLTGVTSPEASQDGPWGTGPGFPEVSGRNKSLLGSAGLAE